MFGDFDFWLNTTVATVVLALMRVLQVLGLLCNQCIIEMVNLLLMKALSSLFCEKALLGIRSLKYDSGEN